MSEHQRPELRSPSPSGGSALLTRPAFIVAVVVLLLNDHVFKQAFGGWWTGKLSDFAGLFAFPLLWCAIWPRGRRIIFVTTAVGFVLWKSPLSETFLTAWAGLGLWPMSRVIDYSDWAALLVLAPSYWLLHKRVKDGTLSRSPIARKLGAVASAVVALVSVTATSLPPPLYVIGPREGHDVPSSSQVVKARLDSLGLHPSSPIGPLWRRHRSTGVDTINIVGGHHRMLIEVRGAGADHSVVTLLKGATYGDLAREEEIRRTFLAAVIEPLRELAGRSSKVGSREPIGATGDTIARLWAEYLNSKHGHYGRNAGTRSRFWLSTEQERWRMYDLAGFYVLDSAVPRVKSIRRATPGGEEFEIVTDFLPAGASPLDSAAAPNITTTVYAVRDSGRWFLANALPRKTAGWHRERVGQITYFVEPGLAFDRGRALRAASFLDSLSAAFEVPGPDSLDYYVASTVDVALGIIGVQYPAVYGPNGGFAKPENRQLFSGIPALGENYRHELTHIAMAPFFKQGTPTWFASEGFATWLGGTEGQDFRGSVRALARYLAVHPQVDLDSLMEFKSVPLGVFYAGGAVLSDMVARTGGAAALKEFHNAGPTTSELRETLTRLLRRSWREIVSEWRKTVIELAGPTS